MGNASMATVLGKTHQQWGKQPLPHLYCTLGFAWPRSLLPAKPHGCELCMYNLSSDCVWYTLFTGKTGTLEDTSRTVERANRAGSWLHWGIRAHGAGGQRAPTPPGAAQGRRDPYAQHAQCVQRGDRGTAGA